MLAHDRRASIPGDRELRQESMEKFICRRSLREQLRVVDVYDSAAAIGKDFELLIDRYGTDAVQSLMPKVIGVLEDLETLATKNEEEFAMIGNLQMAVSRLEAEKLARAEEKSRYECELEQIEETWQSESKTMLELINTLREENHRLLTDLEEQRKDKCSPSPPQPVKAAVDEDQLKLVNQLKVTINDQRDQIRALKRDIQQRTVDIDALQQQSDALARLNADLRRKQNVSQKQAEHLLDEKSNLEADLQSKEQLLRQMRGFVHSDSSESDGPNSPHKVVTKSNIDNRRISTSLPSKGTNTSPDGGLAKPNTETEASSPLVRRRAQTSTQRPLSDLITSTIGKPRAETSLAESLAIAQSGDNSFTTPLTVIVGGISMSEDEFVEKLNNEGKMIIDTKDPERPRFTMQELRDVLKERNELKTKLIEVEEELKAHRTDCDSPVQGPINREPDEKLRPNRNPQEFGIKHFFQRLMERLHD